MIRLSILLAILLFLSWVTVKGVLERPWFNHGLSPLEIHVHDPADLSAKSCKNCHQAEYEDWSRSKHREAFTNAHFQEGFQLEKSDRCVYCHAPLQVQLDEYHGKSKTQLLDEGVNCAACHIRDGKFWSGKEASDLWHTTEKHDLFKSAQFCAGCHQFNLDHTVNGQADITELSAQNTYREWEIYKERGGTQTCQNCHMPGGRHLFQGASSHEKVKSAVSFQATRQKNQIEFRIQSKDVGHNVPTGDVFRNIQLQVSEDGKSFKTIYYFGKKYEIKVNEETGDMRQELTSNTSLEPFKEVVIQHFSKKPIWYRLRYYYVSERGYRISNLNKKDLRFDIQKGFVPL